MAFQFELPQLADELSPKAKDVINIGFLVERLTEENRKRVAHRSERPENVAEHTLMVGKIAVAIAQKYYPDLDPGKVAIYALAHDDHEAYIGDIPSGEWCGTDYQQKASLDEAGIGQLEKEFGDSLPDYVGTVVAYNQQTEPEARFVRMVDKLAVPVQHVVDGGQQVNEHFTLESYLSNERHRREKVKDYDDWQEMIDLMAELACYIADHLVDRTTTP